MKVLVVGQGGREHALVWKLRQCPKVTQVFCAPGNAGTSEEATNIELSVNDLDRLVRFAKSEAITLTVIGPEAPLTAGIVDAFQAANLREFGPNKAAAQLEGSKVFAKEVMRAAKVPTADFKVFTDPEAAARQTIESFRKYFRP